MLYGRSSGLTQPGGSVRIEAASAFFSHYPIPELVATEHWVSIVEDQMGFHWMLGTPAGPMRFDGETFRPTLNDRPLQGVIGQQVFSDRIGRLFFLGRGSLACYDPVADSIHSYRVDPLTTYSAAYMDRSDRLWVLGNNASTAGSKLYWLDRAIDSLVAYDYRGKQAQRDGAASSVSLDHPGFSNLAGSDALAGCIWQVYRMGDHETGLLRFDPLRDVWTAYPLSAAFSTNFSDAICLFADTVSNRLWLSGWRTGLWAFDPQARSWHCPVPHQTILDIAASPQGDLWLAAYENGLMRYAPQTGRAFQYASLDNKSTFRGKVLSVSTDQDGRCWVGTSEGLYCLDPYLQHFVATSPLPPEGLVAALGTDPAAHVVFALSTQERLTQDYRVLVDRWEPGSGQTVSRVYEPWPLEYGELPNFIQRDARGRYWAGHQLYLDTASLALRLVPEAAALPAQRPVSAWMALPTAKGDIWFANRWGGLVHVTDSGMHHFCPFGTPPGEYMPEIRDILPASQGKMWLATSQCLALYDSQNGALQRFHYPGDNLRSPTRITDLAFDSSGRLWVASAQGLASFDTATFVFQVFPAPPYSIHRMVITADAAIWAKSTEGLVRYLPQQNRSRLYTAEDGLRVDLYERIALSPDGGIMLGNRHYWRSETIHDNQRPPTLRFTDFSVLGQPRSLPTGSAPQVALAYDEHSFSISFAASNITRPSLNHYRWQLEGFDDEWIEGGPKCRASYSRLPPGDYVFQVVAANNDGYPSAHALRMKVNIAQAWWRRADVRIAGAAIVLLFITWLIRTYIARIRAEAQLRQRDSEHARQQAELKQRLAEMEMIALRAQMNPHFLFNVLMSVNRLLLENQSEQAATYLNKFARLIRFFLEHSQLEKTSLADDIHALRLYLELEALRFKDKIRWEIVVDPALNPEHIPVIPMFIQPYVENAIWHGLMQKIGGGRVRISFSLLRPDLLCVEVEDDGVGRAKAAEMASRSALRQKSFGLQLARDRLELLSTHHQKASIDLIDRHDAQGEPCGTRVVLHIPI